MNSSNDIFSLSRFVAFAKKELIANRRMLLMQYGVFLGAITLFGIFLSYGIYNTIWASLELSESVSGDPLVYSMVNSVIEHNWIRIWFACGFVGCGSFIALNMDSKTKRIARIMSPASQPEKFAFGAFLVLVVSPILSFLTIEVFDVIRVISFRYIIYTPCREYVSLMNVVKVILCDVTSRTMTIGLLAVQSIFVLGSCIWLRKPIPKILISLVIIYQILIISGAFWGSDVTIYLTPGVIDILLCIFTAFNWALAYYIFTRAEVVGRIINKK
ncbi:MAG: hypothetical protein ACI4UN_03180 [Muribaculaceae bacterium]